VLHGDPNDPNAKDLFVTCDYVLDELKGMRARITEVKARAFIEKIKHVSCVNMEASSAEAREAYLEFSPRFESYLDRRSDLVALVRTDPQYIFPS